MSDIIIQTKNLKKYFNVGKSKLHAVDDVNLSIRKGTTLGIVGESGCGKSTLGRVILNLIEATSGEVLYNGENLLKYNSSKMRQARQKLQIVFQDPYASLNPRMTISNAIAEPIIFNRVLKSRKEVDKRVYELMDLVGLSRDLEYTYPHELDGGRRQRVVIARALSMNPEFIVCDEPVSALDVSIQAQTLNLLMDLQEMLNLSYMFITHDLSVVKHISTEIAVMYLGQIVEQGLSDELFANPLHPYTQALLGSILVPKINTSIERQPLRGELSSPVDPQPGCRFAPRCPKKTSACMENDMPLKNVSPTHKVACILYSS